jgi:transcriptional regulator with XRE-family HTH domain
MDDTERKKLKDFFKERKITQVQIAELTGSTQQTVQKLLNHRAFGKKTAAKWSECFGLNPAWLMTGIGNMMLKDEQEEMDTAKKVVNEGADVFYQQLMTMISKGELYPASIVKEKDTELQRKDMIIEELNREIGTLKQKIAQLEGQEK